MMMIEIIRGPLHLGKDGSKKAWVSVFSSIWYKIGMEPTEKIRMRWVEVLPTVHDGREMFVLRDPEGITNESLVVSREVLLIISLMDGTRSLRDIQEAYMRACGGLLYTDHITSVIEALDTRFLLQNGRYEEHLGTLRAAYDAEPFRTSFLAGRSYPGDEAELRAFMGAMIKERQKPSGEQHLLAMIAPHIDYGRGSEVYSQTYSHFPEKDHTLFVIFGTCHKPAPRMWNISLKDLVTPLGRVRSPGEVGRLVREDRVLRSYVDEWPHRNEHSIELQLPIIQFLSGEKEFEVLSVLTGSLHQYMEDGERPDQGEAADLVGRLKALLMAHAGPCVFLAAADLAHIGAQFGDPAPLDRFVLEESKQKDEALLGAMAEVDGAGFFEAVRKEGDRRRICGLAPIYFLLSMLDPCRGQVVGYQQWTDGASSVSFAGAIFCQDGFAGQSPIPL
jgi:hypothetical protein